MLLPGYRSSFYAGPFRNGSYIAFISIDIMDHNEDEVLGEKGLAAMDAFQMSGAISRLALPARNGYQFVDLSGLVRLQAEGAYTRLVCSDGSKHLTSRSLGFFEKALPSDQFFRCHHSHIVNLAMVSRAMAHGGYRAYLLNGCVVEISRRRWADFLAAIRVRPR